MRWASIKLPRIRIRICDADVKVKIENTSVGQLSTILANNSITGWNFSAYEMLTDMTPTASQFYGSQIPAMGMNITNIANHMQKPTMNNVSAPTSNSN